METTVKQQLYYQTLDWKTYWANFFRQNKHQLCKALRDSFGSDSIFLTRAGRTGISLSLKAFNLKREDEVLVPRFMSTCVLNTINEVAIPSLHLTDRTRAVLFYHHWGFPQDYAKAIPILEARKIWVIEDCAHGAWGESQGWRTGDFGHTAIFSLSKTFEMTYGGALKINDMSLVDPIRALLGQKTSFKDFITSIFGEWAYLSYYNSPLNQRNHADRLAGLLEWYSHLQAYPKLTTVRGLLPRSREEVEEVFKKQNHHFLMLLRAARHKEFMISGDCEARMAPLCFPLLSEDMKFLESVDLWLRDRNIFVGIYHFDVNRCMFEPNYRKCVPLPLYASLPASFYIDFCNDFKGQF